MKTFNSYLLITNSGNSKESANALIKKLGITTHPADFVEIEPEGLSISIDQIRDLKKTIFQKPLASTHKLVIIKEAQLLTHQAQNSILKILEEPPETAIIILIANKKTGLLPTVISRLVTISQPVAATPQEENLSDENLLTVSEIEMPQEYIDRQIKLLFKNVVQNVEDKPKRIMFMHNIELAKEAKKMLSANVNAKFVLSGYLLRKK